MQRARDWCDGVLTRVDTVTRPVQYIAAFVIGMALDEVEMHRIRRRSRSS